MTSVVFPEPAIEYARAARRYREEEQPSDRRTGGGRRRTPAVLTRVGQCGPERRREPHEVEDRQTGEDRGDQDPRALAVVERDECVSRRTDSPAESRRRCTRRGSRRTNWMPPVRHKRSQNAEVVYTLLDDVMVVVDALM